MISLSFHQHIWLGFLCGFFCTWSRLFLVSHSKIFLFNRLPVLATPKTPAAAASVTQPLHIETPARGGSEESSTVPQTPKGDPKRSSSFVETGFEKTLKTQFTPGQPLSPSLSSAIEERVTGIQLSHENENLKAEIRDLNEKLETLKGLLFHQILF